MENFEKATEISKHPATYGVIKPETQIRLQRYNAAMLMAEWKDKQMNLLIDAIDHAYLQTDGTYGELSYEVSDQVKYLKNQLKGK